MHAGADSHQLLLKYAPREHITSRKQEAIGAPALFVVYSITTASIINVRGWHLRLSQS